MNLGITIDSALASRGTFYEKRWQGNGFYPIYKYVWDEELQQYVLFNQKSDKWVNWGGHTEKELRFEFQYNLGILSFEEMKDNNNFNDK